MNKAYQQFKLQSGEEIICEVVEWQSYETDEETWDVVVVKHAFTLYATVDFARGIRYYTFKPFMMYQEKPDQKITIAAQHITSMAEPHPYIVGQWMEFIDNLARIAAEETAHVDPLDTKMDELEEALRNMSDSDKIKIIDFRGNRDKLH